MPVLDNLLLDIEPEANSSVLPKGEFYVFGNRRNAVANTTVVGMVFFSGAPMLSDSAKQFITRLHSFRSLHPDWDGYGATPPTAENIDRAVSFISRADRNLLPIYFVAPGPNGELVIEFRHANKEAAAYLHPDGSTELILQEGNNYILEGTVEENYKDLLKFINV